jgi:hypothetical protein
MNKEIEQQLLEQLKFKSGLDREKLSELLNYADGLLDGLETGGNPEATSFRPPPRWWIKGTPPVWDSIGFEIYLDKEQILELVNRIDADTRIKYILGKIEISPGFRSGPLPDPWKLKGSLGDGPVPDPW